MSGSLDPSLLTIPQFTMLVSLSSQYYLRSEVGPNILASGQPSLQFQPFCRKQAQSACHIDTLLPVMMPLSLGIQRTTAFLVVGLVLVTLLAESSVGFRNPHHVCGSTFSHKYIYMTNTYIMFEGWEGRRSLTLQSKLDWNCLYSLAQS